MQITWIFFPGTHILTYCLQIHEKATIINIIYRFWEEKRWNIKRFHRVFMFLSFIFLQRTYLHFNVAKKNVRPFSSRFSIHSKIIIETRKKVIWIKFTKGKFALQTHLQQIDVIVLYICMICVVLYCMEYTLWKDSIVITTKKKILWLMTYNLWTQLYTWMWEPYISLMPECIISLWYIQTTEPCIEMCFVHKTFAFHWLYLC